MKSAWLNKTFGNFHCFWPPKCSLIHAYLAPLLEKCLYIITVFFLYPCPPSFSYVVLSFEEYESTVEEKQVLCLSVLKIAEKEKESC